MLCREGPEGNSCTRANEVHDCIIPTPNGLSRSNDRDALGSVAARTSIGEFISGYEANGWWGLWLSQKYSHRTINTLNKEINVALADPELTARLAVPARDGSGAQNKMIHFVAVDAATTRGSKIV